MPGVDWSRWDDAHDPSPSWDECARRAGVDPPLARPGDRLEASHDVQAYWPRVRPVWERNSEGRHGLIP